MKERRDGFLVDSMLPSRLGAVRSARSAFSAVRLLFALVVLFTVYVVAGCEQQGPAEKAGEKLDQAAENASDKMDEAKQSLTD
jgi:hyperosmotically inducible protein